MKQLIYFICCGLIFFLLCGFEAGEQVEAEKNKQSSSLKSDKPVLKYEETIVPQKSSQELYQQYHLLITSSLEEAAETITQNRHWAYRMAENGYRYIKLLDRLLIDKHKGAFDELSKQLQEILNDMKRANLSTPRQKRITEHIEKVAAELEKSFNFKKVKSWIKK